MTFICANTHDEAVLNHVSPTMCFCSHKFWFFLTSDDHQNIWHTMEIQISGGSKMLRCRKDWNFHGNPIFFSYLTLQWPWNYLEKKLAHNTYHIYQHIIQHSLVIWPQMTPSVPFGAKAHGLCPMRSSTDTNVELRSYSLLSYHILPVCVCFNY